MYYNVTSCDKCRQEDDDFDIVSIYANVVFAYAASWALHSLRVAACSYQLVGFHGLWGVVILNDPTPGRAQVVKGSLSLGTKRDDKVKQESAVEVRSLK